MLLDITSYEGPRYLRVYEALRQAILAGTLAPGERLPGTRELAADLGVSRTVTLQAFALLQSEGYTVMRPGDGTYVHTQLPDEGMLDPVDPAETGAVAAAKPTLSAYGQRAAVDLPHLADFPPPPRGRKVIDTRYTAPLADERALDHWWKALSRSRRRVMLSSGAPAWGLHALRTVVAHYLRNERGVDAEAEDILITTGAQQALDLIARVLIDPGSTVALEEPHYEGARAIFGAHGARIVACALNDGDGLDVEAHARALQGSKLLMVMPSHQFPTGAVMSLPRRRALMRWAYAQGAYVLEEDIDCEYRYGIGVLPSLHSMDRHDRVIYIGSFARLLFPGSRLGFMVVPRTLRDVFRASKWMADKGGSLFEQQALLNFVESGDYERARRRLLRGLDARRQRLCAALRAQLGRAVRIGGDEAGLFLYVRLPDLPVERLPELLQGAARLGLQLYSAAPYFHGGCRESALVLGYAGMNIGDVEEVALRLATAYRACAAPAG